MESTQANHSSTDSEGARWLSLDALRGLIIVLMALDHANYFIANQHSSGEYWGGAFPTYDDPLAFLTRFVTHLSAPGFFFLMGAGMALFAASRRSKGWRHGDVLRHFMIRGALLILLQLSLVNLAWRLGPERFPAIYIGVLVALGGTMILGGFLFRLPDIVLIALSVGLFLGTEWLHPEPGMWGLIRNDPLNLVLLRSGGDFSFWSNYPILPWLELVVFGLLFGRWLQSDSRRAYRRGLALGGAFLLLFGVLRALDGFGNIRPRPGADWISILNVVKYPPSMTFTLLTMGVNLSVLWLFWRVRDRARVLLEPLAVFGRAPLFVYITHLFLYMLLGRLLAPDGTSLLVTFPLWLLGLLILYPAARWYGRVRGQSSPRSVLRFI